MIRLILFLLIFSEINKIDTFPIDEASISNFDQEEKSEEHSSNRNFLSELWKIRFIKTMGVVFIFFFVILIFFFSLEKKNF